MDNVSLERFAPLCGEPFALSVDAEPPLLNATLIEAKALPQPAFNGRQPFSLVFAGPPAPLLPQSIYRVAHQSLPALDIFLVPVAADASSVRYQAVFS
jgi:hypothetical protein